MLEQNARAGSLFGAHGGSARIREGGGRGAPTLDVEPDAATGREIEVTDTLLLDTDMALWLDGGDDPLYPSMRALPAGCWRNGGAILLSAITGLGACRADSA